MNINEVKKIIEETIRRKGYVLRERKSASTGSWYFEILSPSNVSLLFRVSDHGTKKDVITLRLDHRINPDRVRNFADNRCRDLSYRCVKKVLGM